MDVRYHNSLDTNFYEEQLYYFYAIKILGFDDILSKNADLVLKKNNQILKSYYLLYNLFNEDQINILKSNTNEDQWFLNYHLILFDSNTEKLEDNIRKFLIPKQALEKKIKEENYLNFYKQNIENCISLIKDVESIENGIQDYIDLKILERTNSEIECDSEEIYEEQFEYDYY